MHQCVLPFSKLARHELAYSARADLRASYVFFLPLIGYGRISIHEGPADTNATVGNIVPCYCKYTGTEDLPLWAINGVIHSPSDLPRGYMVNKTGLYFQAFQEMHMSTYQCLFNIFSASTQSVETIPSTIGTVFVMQGQ